MDKLHTKENVRLEHFLFLIRGYMVPLIGATIIILMGIFIYFPNITGIIANIQRLNSKNIQFTLLKQRIEYFKNISDSTANTTNLSASLGIIDTRIPEQLNSADSINTLEGLLSKDNLKLINISSNVLQQGQYGQNMLLDPNIRIDEIDLQVTGSEAAAESLFNDVNTLPTMKQLAEITSSSILGQLNANQSVQITFSVYVFALDTSNLVHTVNMNNNVNLSLTPSYLETL